jgi:cytochrome c oxidase subunit III
MPPSKSHNCVITLPTLTLKPGRLQSGGGRRGPVDHRDFGGGGGGRGDGAPNYGERLRRCRLGLALALVAIVLLFAMFSGAFMVREQLGTWDAASGMYIRDWRPLRLPMNLLLINSVLLICSSICIELARRQAAEHAILAPLAGIPGISLGRRRPWLASSGILGTAFLAGQALAWRQSAAAGLTTSAYPSSSFFYVLTGAHALHLLGGMLALSYALIAGIFTSKDPEARRIIVDITAWYWHAMAVLWIYILLFLVLGNS